MIFRWEPSCCSIIYRLQQVTVRAFLRTRLRIPHHGEGPAIRSEEVQSYLSPAMQPEQVHQEVRGIERKKGTCYMRTADEA